MGTWILNIKASLAQTGNPYRAFAYMKDLKMKSGGSTVSFTFKAKGHNTVYTKLFFWGDGNNILGLKPGAGGTSQFCFMPSADAPLSMIKCEAVAECKDDTWYRVDMVLSGSGSVALKVDGKDVGSGTVGNFNANPQIGCYQWSVQGKTMSDYQLYFRDMCLGMSTPAVR